MANTTCTTIIVIKNEKTGVRNMTSYGVISIINVCFFNPDL